MSRLLRCTSIVAAGMAISSYDLIKTPRVTSDSLNYEQKRRVIGVMGPGVVNEGQYKEIEELGSLIAKNDWILLTGGRNCGVMDACSKGCYENNGIVVGILPADNKDKMSKYVNIPIITGMGSARNNINVLSSDIIVGCYTTGFGTLSEIALALKAKKPVILYQCSESCKENISEVASYSRTKRVIMEANTPQQVIDCINTIIQMSE